MIHHERILVQRRLDCILNFNIYSNICPKLSVSFFHIHKVLLRQKNIQALITVRKTIQSHFYQCKREGDTPRRKHDVSLFTPAFAIPHMGENKYRHVAVAEATTGRIFYRDRPFRPHNSFGGCLPGDVQRYQSLVCAVKVPEGLYFLYPEVFTAPGYYVKLPS